MSLSLNILQWEISYHDMNREWYGFVVTFKYLLSDLNRSLYSQVSLFFSCRWNWIQLWKPATLALLFCDSPTNTCSKPDESLMLSKRFFICYYRKKGLYREAPPKRGTFFRLQVYQMVGSFLVSSESNFTPETPREVIFLDEFFS